MVEKNDVIKTTTMDLDHWQSFSDIRKSNNSNSFFPLFRDILPVGKGGFSIVFKATHSLDGIDYAIKAIPVNGNNIDSVLSELVILSKLNHQNIVRYHTSWITADCFEPEAISILSSVSSDNFSDNSITVASPKEKAKCLLCIQMEYCPTTLEQWLEQRTQIELSSCIKILKQLVDTVNYIHNQGIIHRDLKPSNIFIDNSCNIKIGDFGLSKFVPGTDHKKFSLKNTGDLGSPVYSSPEQLKNQPYNHLTDFYSIGVIMLDLFFRFSTEMEKVQFVMSCGGRANDMLTHTTGTENGSVLTKSNQTKMTDFPDTDLDDPELIQRIITIIKGLLQPLPKRQILTDRDLTKITK